MAMTVSVCLLNRYLMSLACVVVARVLVALEPVGVQVVDPLLAETVVVELVYLIHWLNGLLIMLR